MAEVTTSTEEVTLTLAWLFCFFMFVKNKTEFTTWFHRLDHLGVGPVRLYDVFRERLGLAAISDQTTDGVFTRLRCLAVSLSNFVRDPSCVLRLIDLEMLAVPYQTSDLLEVHRALALAYSDIRLSLENAQDQEQFKQFLDKAPAAIQLSVSAPSQSAPVTLGVTSLSTVSQPPALLPVSEVSHTSAPPSLSDSSVAVAPAENGGEPLATSISGYPPKSHADHLLPSVYQNMFVTPSMQDMRRWLVTQFGTLLAPEYDDKGTGIYYVKCKVQAPLIPELSRRGDKGDGLCPWGATLKEAADGSVAYLGPVYSGEHFEKACQLPLALQPVDGRVDVQGVLSNSNFFVTVCGHVHYADGPVSGKPPPLLDARAKEAVEQSRGDFDAALRILEADAALKNFSAGFATALRKHKVVVRPAVPFRSLESVRETLTKLYSPTKPLSIDKFPADDRDLAVFTMKHNDEIFAYACTRASAELTMTVGCIHIDATFNVIKQGKDSDDRVLTVAVQDAVRKIYLAGVMVARSESLQSYEVLFLLMVKSWEAVDPTLQTLKLRRFVFDGFKGLAELIRKFFTVEKFGSVVELIFRASCLYHSITSARRHTKGIIAPGNDCLPGLVVHLMHEIGSAPSPAAVLALWEHSKVLVEQLDDSVLSETERNNLFAYMDAWYLNPENEVFFWQACADKRRVTPRGPVFSRSNNVNEASHSKMKRQLDKFTPEELSTREDATIVLGKMIENTKHSEFCKELDVLSIPEFRHLAIIKRFRINRSLSAAGRAWPDRASRLFLYCRVSKLLFGVEETKARELVGHFVEEKDCPSYRAPHWIKVMANRVNGPTLSALMKDMNIIQFHPEHLPGSKDSFAWATCSCPVNTVDALCDCVLAIHFHFFDTWQSQAGPGEPPPPGFCDKEMNKWDCQKEVLHSYGISSHQTIVTGEGPEISDDRQQWSTQPSGVFKCALQKKAVFTRTSASKEGRQAIVVDFMEKANKTISIVAGFLSDAPSLRSAAAQKRSSGTALTTTRPEPVKKPKRKEEKQVKTASGIAKYNSLR